MTINYDSILVRHNKTKRLVFADKNKLLFKIGRSEIAKFM